MKKLKRSVVLIFILFCLFITSVIGIIANNSEDTIIIETKDTVPVSFVRNINNTNNVDKEIIDLITKYMDAYFLSLYSLEKIDVSTFFDNDVIAHVSNKAIELLIESRKLYDYDFKMNDAYYDLDIIEVINNNGVYEVSFLEDDHFSFNFLDGIESKCFGIENKMFIKKVNNEYKIIDYEKIQGYYSLFYDNKIDSIKKCDELYDYYLKQVKKVKENDDYLKLQAKDKPYFSDKTYSIKYDRVLANEYAYKYYHLRNSDWYDFSLEGGNCQNYASQCIYNGLNIMDYSGDYQWKCYMEDGNYDPYINEDDVKEGRSTSWVHVSSFKDYCENNMNSGLVTDCGVNINYAEVSDIIQVGISSVTHTTIVSKVVNGHILINSNSIDMMDYPLEASVYLTKNLIKILGANE